jgi:uncharacterized membrane protein YcfT
VSAPGGERVAWIDFAKGICIIGVVTLYATMYVEGLTLDASWVTYGVEFLRPVRMPAFFLISGLFLARTIDRPWPEYLDKKILHFSYFFVLWTTIYFAAGLVSGEFAGRGALWADYLDWYVEPFHMLWFIQMLPIYLLVTRLLRRVPWVVVLAAAALLQIWAPESGWRPLDRFGERYVYFYAGYIFAPFVFRFAQWARGNRWSAVLLIASWTVINDLLVLADFAGDRGISLVLGFTGSAAVIAVASLLSGSRPMDWLRHVGEHSLVVFLSFFLVTVASARILDALDLVKNSGLETLLVMACSVAGPLVAYRVVRPSPLRFLFERPRWAQWRHKPRRAPAEQPAMASVLPVEPIGPAQIPK